MSAATRPENETTADGTSTRRPSAQRTGRRFAPVKALSVVGSLTLSVGGLMTVSSVIASPANAVPAACTAPTGGGLQQNLNTTLGCDVIDGTSLMSGFISDSGLDPHQQVTFEDAYEGLSSHNFYYGAYSLTLNCNPGAASPVTSNYVIEQGTGSYPLTPPTVSSGALPVVTADSSGNIVCAYSLTVQTAPGGHLNSSKSDLWIVSGGSGHTATTSVKPPVLGNSSDPTTTTPTTAPSDPTTTVVTDPTTTTPTTAPSDPTTTVVTDPTTTTPTTAPSHPTTTVVSDPTTTTPTTAPSDPTTTVVTDPTTTTPTTAPATKDPGDTTTTTAPVLQTATVADPSNSHTFVNNPTDVTVAPSSSSSTGTPAAGPSTPATFNPKGLTALAFTGSMSEELAVVGLILVLAGGLILGISRRRQGASS